MKKVKLLGAVVAILAVAMIQSCQKEKIIESPETLSAELTASQKVELDNVLTTLLDSVQVGGGVEFLSKSEYDAIPKADENVIAALNPEPLQTRASSLRLVTPPVLNQGNEGSCTAFSIGYVGVSHLMYAIKRLPYTTTGALRSPEFLFNLTKASNNCSGAYMSVVLNTLINTGVCSWSVMPYTSYSCSVMPNNTQRQKALEGRINTYYTVSSNQIKNVIASGYPVMMAFNIDDQFIYQTSRWPYTYKTKGGGQRGGHAVAIVGYNDNNRTYVVQNSWGTGAHDRGFFYISYDLMPYIATEMYVMSPRR
jgi:C1A family cysteine protease